MHAFRRRTSTPCNPRNSRIRTQCWERIVGGGRHGRTAHLRWTALRHSLLHRKRLLLIHDVHIPTGIPHLLLHEHELPLLVYVHGVHVAGHLLREIRACYAGVYAGCVVTLIAEWIHAALLRLGVHLLGLGYDG